MKSSTTSSRSATSSSRPTLPIHTPVQYIKGVGPRLGALLAKRDLHTVKDLLTFFPRTYEDRSKIGTVADLIDGEKGTVSVEVYSARPIRLRGRRRMFEARCGDDSGNLKLKWFHVPYGIEDRIRAGSKIMVTGTVKGFRGGVEMVHPEITFGETAQDKYNAGRIVPIYREIEGISTRVLRKVLWECITHYGDKLVDDLPRETLNRHRLPLISRAVQELHFPTESTLEDLQDCQTPAHWRLIYEEFFKFEYFVLKRRLHMKKETAPHYPLEDSKEAVQTLQAKLPFQLTDDQQKSITEVLEDLSLPHPMNRLVQGDVGSGKTVVALLTAAAVIAKGSQVALMAPTEILAEQHFSNAIQLFGTSIQVELLTGKTPAKNREKLSGRLQTGEPILLIGTHALIEDPIQFTDLGYVIIDEQHRFGVDQRRMLASKSIQYDRPHTLVMTATPIPRTLALTAYGDLATSTIRQMPPGRTPVKTHVVREQWRERAYERIREEILQGRQAYFIFPLVNESEAEGFTALKSAVQEAEALKTEIFPEFEVGILHGQMKSDEKTSVMNTFKRGKIDILVSTTVVEVGVDVPNATVIAVEHAERFGLSQLHQLRGRVGRGKHQSYCFLFAGSKQTESAVARLGVMEKTTNGFKIAEADLEIRGPGEFLGIRQAGAMPFKLAHLIRDQDWLTKARSDVIDLLKDDPELLDSKNQVLRRYFAKEGRLEYDRLHTS